MKDICPRCFGELEVKHMEKCTKLKCVDCNSIYELDDENVMESSKFMKGE